MDDIVTIDMAQRWENLPNYRLGVIFTEGFIVLGDALSESDSIKILNFKNVIVYYIMNAVKTNYIFMTHQHMLFNFIFETVQNFTIFQRWF